MLRNSPGRSRKEVGFLMLVRVLIVELGSAKDLETTVPYRRGVGCLLCEAERPILGA